MHPILALHMLIRLHSPAILCLHGRGSGADALPAGNFRAMLDRLVKRGYRFLTLDDVVRTRVLRRRTIALTFDDGRRDNLTVVLPILREYGIAATFYVCAELVGRRIAFPSHPDRDDAASGACSFDLMDWDGLRELRDAGMCIGSHTATHPDLTRCPEDRLAHETAGSKRLIEERLGIPVRHFAYPWGRFDARVLSHVRQAGYETGAAVSVNPAGLLQPWDAFTLSRVTAHPAATELELIRSVGFRNLVRRTLSQVRRNAGAAPGRAGS